MAFPTPYLSGFRTIDGESLDKSLAFPVWSLATNIAAKTGGTVNTATPITETLTIVSSVPTVGAGVTLPNGVPGRVLYIQNASAKDMTVFADNGTGTINGVSGSTGYTHPAGANLLYTCTGPQRWTVFSSAQGGYFGNFYDTTTQTNTDPTQPQIMTLNSGAGYGFSVQSGSKITAQYPGYYNLMFSAQLNKTGGGQADLDIWIRTGSSGGAASDVPWSNTRVTMPSSAGSKLVAAWNFIVQLDAGDFVQLAWFCSDATMQIYSTGTSAAPTRPAIPSVIATINGV